MPGDLAEYGWDFKAMIETRRQLPSTQPSANEDASLPKNKSEGQGTGSPGFEVFDRFRLLASNQLVTNTQNFMVLWSTPASVMTLDP